MDLNSDFKEFIGLLNARDVKHLIVGGYAVAFHGHPRYTKDLDFWILAEPENAQKLLAAIREFGFEKLDLTETDFLALENVVQLGQPPNRIDLLMSIRDLDFQKCYERSQAETYEGLTIRYLGLEDLIESKLKAGRPQDKVDAKKLSKALKKK